MMDGSAPLSAPPPADTVAADHAAEPSQPPAGVKPTYPPPAQRPTQPGPEGIFFDFNHGCRVQLPPRDHGQWRIRLRDLDTGSTLFQSDNQGAMVRSAKRWFVRFGIEVWSLEGDGEPKLVLSHAYDATGQDILIQFPVGTLGDVLAWFPYAARFAGDHPGSRVTCALSGLIIPLLRYTYPTLTLVTHEEASERDLPARAYATYSLGLFFSDTACEFQPTDFRQVGLHRTAGFILGVDPREEKPRLALPDETRPIAEPYVCIAVQSTTQAKCWNNPRGWHELIGFLRASFYRVICIDQAAVNGQGIVWNHLPHGAEDQTGDRPLAERARWLRHADFFVGLSSGLSWLAWAAGTPVVLISGFTHPDNEFATPYRVINWHTCNSCWNDPRLLFDHKDFLWCPRHAGTARQFECTRLIGSEQVIGAIKRIPAFRSHTAAIGKATDENQTGTITE